MTSPKQTITPVQLGPVTFVWILNDCWLSHQISEHVPVLVGWWHKLSSMTLEIFSLFCSCSFFYNSITIVKTTCLQEVQTVQLFVPKSKISLNLNKIMTLEYHTSNEYRVIRVRLPAITSTPPILYPHSPSLWTSSLLFDIFVLNIERLLYHSANNSWYSKQFSPLYSKWHPTLDLTVVWLLLDSLFRTTEFTLLNFSTNWYLMRKVFELSASRRSR